MISQAWLPPTRFLKAWSSLVSDGPPSLGDVYTYTSNFMKMMDSSTMSWSETLLWKKNPLKKHWFFQSASGKAANPQTFASRFCTKDFWTRPAWKACGSGEKQPVRCERPTSQCNPAPSPWSDSGPNILPLGLQLHLHVIHTLALPFALATLDLLRKHLGRALLGSCAWLDQNHLDEW